MGQRETDWHEKYDGYLYVPALMAPLQTLREAQLADALEEALVEWKALAEAFACSDGDIYDKRGTADADLDRISRLRALLETK